MHKISIGVMATLVNKKYQHQMRDCQDTWVKIAEEYNIPVYYFVGGQSQNELDLGNFEKLKNIIHLQGVGDDYHSSYFKQFNGLKWMLTNSKSEYYLLIGTDNYVVIPNLLKMLEKYNSNQYLYIGGHAEYRSIFDKNILFHSGGGGFILTDKLLNKIDETYSLTNNYKDWVNMCKTAKVDYLTVACDVCIATMINYMGIKPTVEKEFYGCDFRGYNTDYKCCPYNTSPDKIIVCHYMDPPLNKIYHNYMLECCENYSKNYTKTLDKCCKTLNNNWTIVTYMMDLNENILNIPINLTIFGDIKLKNDIKQYRKNKGLAEYTQFIEMSEDTYKIEMLKIASDHNKFSSNYWAWLDYDYNTKVGPYSNYIVQALEQYREKISVCYINYVNNDTINNGEYSICTSFYTIGNDYLIKFYNAVKSKPSSYNENQSYSLVNLEHSDWFDVYFGREIDSVFNYVDLQFNQQEIIKNIIPKLLDYSNYVLCSQVCKQILDSYFKYNIKLNNGMLIDIVNKYFTSEYWLGRKSGCIEILKYNLLFASNDKEYDNEFNKQYSLLISNSDYIYHDLPVMKNAIVKTDDINNPQIKELIDLDFRVFVYGNYQVTTKSLIINNPVIRPLHIKYQTEYTLEVD